MAVDGINRSDTLLTELTVRFEPVIGFKRTRKSAAGTKGRPRNQRVVNCTETDGASLA